jgi:hypothetical protein
VFGDFLGVLAQFTSETTVVFIVASASARAGDGSAGDSTVRQLDKGFG